MDVTAHSFRMSGPDTAWFESKFPREAFADYACMQKHRRSACSCAAFAHGSIDGSNVLGFGESRPTAAPCRA